jgi:hypothetical protein
MTTVSATAQPASIPPGLSDNVAAVLAAVLKDGVYRLVVRDGKVVALTEGGLNTEYMSLEQLAEEFPPNYWWFSRNWGPTLRLAVYKLGKFKVFKRADVYAAIERTRVAPSKPVGRPQKRTMGIIP